MDFSFTDDQLALRDLAASIFTGISDPQALWAQLVDSGLVDIALSEECGGGGLGMIELSLVLEQLGRVLAPVPLVWHAAGAMALAAFAPSLLPSDGTLTAGFARDPYDPPLTFDGALSSTAAGALSGTVLAVPPGDMVLLPAASPDGIALVLAAPGTATPHETTNHSIVHDLSYDAAPATVVAAGQAPVRFLVERCLVGMCAVQLGVASAALERAAAYTSTRIQFGKPLSSFQSTSARAADCYIDVEAMRVTLWQAAWRLDQGLDASTAVEVAKWWASEAGQRVVHAVQHMHGGIGADVEYPIHRYFLWGKQIENTLGGGSSHLARIGAALAAG